MLVPGPSVQVPKTVPQDHRATTAGTFKQQLLSAQCVPDSWYGHWPLLASDFFYLPCLEVPTDLLAWNGSTRF